VEILKEVVRIAPNVADSYHTLGLLYDAKGDRKRALNFYMIAAHLTPKDIVLWKRLASWSMYTILALHFMHLLECLRLKCCHYFSEDSISLHVLGKDRILVDFQVHFSSMVGMVNYGTQLRFSILLILQNSQIG
jgi:tetratricopeptide (TPR) repeat protein